MTVTDMNKSDIQYYMKEGDIYLADITPHLLSCINKKIKGLTCMIFEGVASDVSIVFSRRTPLKG